MESVNDHDLKNDRNYISEDIGKDPKPLSPQQLRAQKSRRIAERRARVAEALLEVPDHDTPTNKNSKLAWHRMSDEELEHATRAAEESARSLQLNDEEFGAQGGKLLRRAHQELTEASTNEHGRKMWGTIYSDPYEPAAGLVSEAEYYGEKKRGGGLQLLHSLSCVSAWFLFTRPGVIDFSCGLWFLLSLGGGGLEVC